MRLFSRQSSLLLPSLSCRQWYSLCPPQAADWLLDLWSQAAFVSGHVSASFPAYIEIPLQKQHTTTNYSLSKMTLNAKYLYWIYIHVYTLVRIKVNPSAMCRRTHRKLGNSYINQIGHSHHFGLTWWSRLWINTHMLKCLNNWVMISFEIYITYNWASI